MVPVPVAVPNAPEPRKPRSVPVPVRSKVADRDTAAGICVTPVRPSPHADRPVLLAHGRDAQTGARGDVEHVGRAEPGAVTMVILSASGIWASRRCSPWLPRSDWLSQ